MITQDSAEPAAAQESAAPAAAQERAAPDVAAPPSKRNRWSANGDGSAEAGGKRQSRWANKEAAPAPGPRPLTSTALALATPGEMLGAAIAMGIPIPIFSAMPDHLRRVMLGAKYAIDQIDRRLALEDCGVSETPPEARSPSPEPVFDDVGNRLNTRAERQRTKLLREREAHMQHMKPPEPPKPAGKRCAAASAAGPRGSHTRSPSRASAAPPPPLPRAPPSAGCCG